jgi:stage II sporulation protein D
VILVLLRRASTAPSVRVEIRGRVRIEPLGGRGVARAGTGLSEDFPLAAGAPARRIRAEEGPVVVNGKPYPGALRLAPGDRGLLPVIETDLEAYVVGVLAGELGSGFTLAALRAQAVASRTYVLSRLRSTPPGQPWHVADDVTAQVFVGVPPEPIFRKAAADTGGLILAWRGAPIPAYFHSTCGGHTAPAEEVFGLAGIPPLSGVPCEFCRSAKYYRWETRLSADDVARAASMPPPATGISVLRRGFGGRALSVLVEGARPATLAASDLRLRLGAEKLRSTLILDIARSGPDFVLSGGGWGHGVGMCQMGAQGMGRAGASASDILAHYYPGAALTRLY